MTGSGPGQTADCHVISSRSEAYAASKDLILRYFQKSGRQFTDFQKKCKAKFL
jgi:hypothetical protein